MQVFKGKVAEQAAGALMMRIELEGFRIVRVLSAQKDELYVIAQKKRNDADAEEGICTPARREPHQLSDNEPSRLAP